MHAFSLQALHEIGVARVLGGVEGDKRLLILPDPAGRRIFYGEFPGGLVFVRPVCFEDV